MAPPDFTDATLFRSFDDCPVPAPAPPTGSSDPAPIRHYLIAEIAHNMTVNKPTLVLHDRTGASFALVFDCPAAAIDLSARGLRKGATAVVAGAERTPPREEGKRGFVSVPADRAGAVRAVPGRMERVFEVGARMRAREAEGGEEMCERCGKKGAEEEGGKGRAALMKCMGCGEVRYCSKVSFYPV
jgi:hypothetical protein